MFCVLSLHSAKINFDTPWQYLMLQLLPLFAYDTPDRYVHARSRGGLRRPPCNSIIRYIMTTIICCFSPEVAPVAPGRPRGVPRGPLVSKAVAGSNRRPREVVEPPKRPFVLGGVEHSMGVHRGREAVGGMQVRASAIFNRYIVSAFV